MTTKKSSRRGTRASDDCPAPEKATKKPAKLGVARPKIGEARGNLQNRAEWFSKRSGK